MDNPKTVDLKRIPLFAMRTELQNYLAEFLNAIKILQSSNGKYRDWRGLFELAKLSNYSESFFSMKDDPTMELIEILKGEPQRITFATFREMLGEIDRWDLFDDTEQMFRKWLYKFC